MLSMMTSRIMPRTTLGLDASILRELRRRGQREGKSMGQLASELLSGALDEPGLPPGADDLSWTAADLGQPLVDLEDKEAVRRAIDAQLAPPSTSMCSSTRP